MGACEENPTHLRDDIKYNEGVDMLALALKPM